MEMAREYVGEAGNFARIRMGRMVEMSKPTETCSFLKRYIPLRPMTLDDGVRIVRADRRSVTGRMSRQCGW